jgi:hypothetical protein
MLLSPESKNQTWQQKLPENQKKWYPWIGSQSLPIETGGPVTSSHIIRTFAALWP